MPYRTSHLTTLHGRAHHPTLTLAASGDRERPPTSQAEVATPHRRCYQTRRGRRERKCTGSLRTDELSFGRAATVTSLPRSTRDPPEIYRRSTRDLPEIHPRSTRDPPGASTDRWQRRAGWRRWAATVAASLDTDMCGREPPSLPPSPPDYSGGPPPPSPQSGDGTRSSSAHKARLDSSEKVRLRVGNTSATSR